MADFITCVNNGSLSIDALLKSLAVKHDDGRYGFRMVVVPITECDDLNDGAVCDENGTAEYFFRRSIMLDPCGKPAIRLFNTADAT